MTQKQQSGSGKESSTENRGFASMDEDKQWEIASKGGKAAHEKGTAHKFDSEEARVVGQKGGKASYESHSKEGRAADHKTGKH